LDAAERANKPELAGRARAIIAQNEKTLAEAEVIIRQAAATRAAVAFAPSQRRWSRPNPR
jgi:hypothetical protein